MPEPKTQYLKVHQRTICPGCRFWVPWSTNKKGKVVKGCQVGEIPYRDECRHRKRR